MKLWNSLLLSCPVMISLSCSASGQPGNTAEREGTVQSCRFGSGQTAHYVETHERRFLIVHGNNGMNDLSEIVHENGQTWIETNGGVAKQIAVSNLIDFLRGTPRQGVLRSALDEVLNSRPNTICPGEFPFSPE